jgi:thymidylate synthase (FAD)
VPEADEALGLYFPVLDHGFVALVDYMGSDAAIESAARVSYGHGTRRASDTRGLLRYLRRHKHTTPTEMVELKFHCAMPMFVARQWVRHRTASVNEYSGRYSLMPLLFYTPPPEQLMRQSADNRQGRGEALPEAERADALRRWREGREFAVATYEQLGAADVARELARIDLPLSTYTQWYWKIDLHNLLHFLTLRVDTHAQWEIREYARVMAGLVRRVAPLTYEAWVDYDLAGASFSRMEVDALRAALASADPKAALDRGALAATLSAREVDEFLSKLAPRERPDFRVDPADAKPGSFFAERFAAAVPAADRHDGAGAALGGERGRARRPARGVPLTRGGRGGALYDRRGALRIENVPNRTSRGAGGGARCQRGAQAPPRGAWGGGRRGPGSVGPPEGARKVKGRACP